MVFLFAFCLFLALSLLTSNQWPVSMGPLADNGSAFVVLEQTGPSRCAGLGQLLFICHNHGGMADVNKNVYADRVRAC